MKIGLISDTHSHLDPKVLEYFQSVDEIWHAGDIGEVSVTQQLEHLKPLRAVYGNIDDKNLQALYPEYLWFDCEGLRIWMTHIAGSPPNYNPRTKKILKEKSADVLICGHSHILKVIKDPKYNLLYINPGAAGNHGFHHIKTIMRFEILNKEIKNMEVIELGKRGKI
ncbi:MAG: metallophosphoesterase family protein [Bacteroidetes bacterium]|nr:metallophosphoesterase family protein [Bacteroidota bacterium]